jgi:hypothetical protein
MKVFVTVYGNTRVRMEVLLVRSLRWSCLRLFCAWLAEICRKLQNTNSVSTYNTIAVYSQICWKRCSLCGPCRGYITTCRCDYEETWDGSENRRKLVWGGRQPGSWLWDSRRPVKMWKRKMMQLRRWKPLPGDNQWRYDILRRFNACCSEL